jgi:hypothetical protein
MFKRFMLPIVLFAVIAVQMTMMNLRPDFFLGNSEADQNYFLKLIPTSNIAVIEPNYKHFFDPNSKVKGDISGENLYEALNDLNDNYGVKDVKMVSFERKGFMIPNLYVYLDNAVESLSVLSPQSPQ